MDYPRAEAEQRPLDRPFVSEIPKLRKLIVASGLTGLSNDTKWNELISAMRSQSSKGWCPSFMFNCIDSEYVSRWDCEWWHHLPFPFLSVRWLDISFSEETNKKGSLLPSEFIDHSKELEALLTKIGLDFKKGKEAFRIFGYAPREMSELTLADEH